MSKIKKLNQAGIAHLGLILVLILFIGAGSLVYWRFSSTNQSADFSYSENASDEEKLQKEVENGLAEVQTGDVEAVSEEEETSNE